MSTHMETINNSRPCGSSCWEDGLMENFISLKVFVCLFLGWNGIRQETRGSNKDKKLFIKSNTLNIFKSCQKKVQDLCLCRSDYEIKQFWGLFLSDENVKWSVISWNVLVVVVTLYKWNTSQIYIGMSSQI